MHHDIEVLADPDTVARRAAEYVADRARAAAARHGRFTFAVSGGHTPWAMFRELADQDMPWEQVVLYQVDERIAPAADPDRNLTHLRDSLRAVAAVHALHTTDILFAITSGRPNIRRDAPTRPRSRSLRRPVDPTELW